MTVIRNTNPNIYRNAAPKPASSFLQKAGKKVETLGLKTINDTALSGSTAPNEEDLSLADILEPQPLIGISDFPMATTFMTVGPAGSGVVSTGRLSQNSGSLINSNKSSKTEGVSH